jgi:hypothetical protein
MAGPEAPFAPEASAASAASAHLPAGPATRGWRRFDRLVLAAFVVGLLLPGLVLATGRRPAAIENRPLLTAPPLSAASLLDGSLTPKLDAFLTDNIYFRPYAIRVRGELEWATGGTGTTAVVRGRDGWLFLGDGLDPVCRYSVDQVLAGLDQLSAAFAANGQDFHFFAVPDKQSIYPENLTTGLRPTACVEQDRPALRVGLAQLGPQAIDGWSAIGAAKASAPKWTPQSSLYFLTDSHWTPTGATAAIRALIDAVDPGLWADKDVVRSGTSEFSTDLARLMGIVRKERVNGVVIRSAMAVSSENLAALPGLEQAVFHDTATGPEPTVPGRTLIVYDSFLGKYPSLVAPFFADTTWIHIDDVIRHPELAAKLGRFDHVIFARVERFFYAEDAQAALSPFIR